MGIPLRTTFLTLIAAGLAAGPALAGEALDESSGTKIVYSDAWRRHAENEQGSRKIVLANSVDKGKYVMLVVEVGTADDFSGDRWIESEKMSIERDVTGLGEMTVDKDRLIGGRASTGFTVSGKIKNVPLRIRAYIVRHGPGVVVFRELSYQGAHEAVGDKELDDLWDGISFQEGEAKVGGDGEGAGGASEAVEDKLGNYKLVMPAGWQQVRAAPVEEATALRTAFERRDDNGNTAMLVEILRFEMRNAEIFKKSPGEIAELLIDEHVFSGYFGANCEAMIKQSMRVDESNALGGADNSGSFVISSRTMQQIAETREAENKKAKGIKGVEVPDFKPTVVRGRVALISPHLYLVRTYIRPDVVDNAALFAEYNKLVDSFEFLSSGAKPPALVVGGTTYGDTMHDPAYAKERKEEVKHTEVGRKAYEMEVSVKLPPGFVLHDKSLGASVSVVIVAQDENNRWFQLIMSHISHRAAGDQNKVAEDKNVRLESWKSNWESKARGKGAKRTTKFAIGQVRGEGYKDLEGEVNGWPATFTAVVGDKPSGWRTYVEIETRGGFGEKYEKEIKALLRGIKLKALK